MEGSVLEPKNKFVRLLFRWSRILGDIDMHSIIDLDFSFSCNSLLGHCLYASYVHDISPHLNKILLFIKKKFLEV